MRGGRRAALCFSASLRAASCWRSWLRSAMLTMLLGLGSTGGLGLAGSSSLMPGSIASVSLSAQRSEHAEILSEVDEARLAGYRLRLRR